ncbi:MAG: DUF2332 family protein [Sphingomonadales bacterium]|nr:DUF2332 family protein [Sphingomonadales bacterium]
MDARVSFSLDALGPAPAEPRDELLRQATVASELGSEFVASVLSAAYLQLERAPRLAALIDRWPHDPRASAMALRLNAGIHALARQGRIASLNDLFAGRSDDFLVAVADAFRWGEATLLAWMDHPTQTNEVARSGAFMAALMLLAQEQGMPFELNEIGASAGLNLMLDRYDHRLGGCRAGTPGSPVVIAPEWRGAAPLVAPVTIAAARGVDLRPLRLDDPLARERLQSYVWADDTMRALRLGHAITLAESDPPQVDRDHAAAWLERRLAAPQPAGTCRVVLHSMVLQYLPADERAAVEATIAAAGGRAGRDAPLALIGFEWDRARTEVRLELTCWNGRSAMPLPRLLARCHAYGAWIDWQG